MDQLQEVLALKGKGGSEATVKQDIMAEVSYKDSTLKGANFINYVSNLKLSINLVKEGSSINKHLQTFFKKFIRNFLAF